MRATAIGAWASSQQLGGIAANLVSAAVLRSYGWRSVFFVSGAAIAAFAPLLAVALPLCAPNPAAARPAATASPPQARAGAAKRRATVASCHSRWEARLWRSQRCLAKSVRPVPWRYAVLRRWQAATRLSRWRGGSFPSRSVRSSPSRLGCVRHATASCSGSPSSSRSIAASLHRRPLRSPPRSTSVAPRATLPLVCCVTGSMAAA